MTPEARVKKQVKALLDACRPYVYYIMPVQNGMGMPTLDFVGCCAGMYFTIETKAEGKAPTPRQRNTLSQVDAAQGKCFVIAGVDSPALKDLKRWLMTTLRERLFLP